MRIESRVLPVALVLIAGACSEPRTQLTAPVFEARMGVVANGGKNAAVPLSGDEEVPARLTRARGTAIFHLSEDRLSVDYKLIVANIENVVASHIHVGPAGANGPVVVFLFGNAPPGGGRLNGVIAEGTFTAANLVGPLAGQPLSVLVDQIIGGNAYVNVHTNDGVGDPNTGPGDFPGGEVRGQIR